MNHPHFLPAILSVLTILEFSLCANILHPDQILADGHVLISPSQMFEMGFFSPGKSSYRFLGIWYRTTPDVVVWVANRNDPIMDSSGALTLSQNGSLLLTTTHSSRVWSTESSRPASSPVLKLLDTGNLVVVEDSTKTQQSSDYLWQSFDYPTDTTYPGSGMLQDPDTGESRNLTSWRSADDPSVGEYYHRIENSGLSQIVLGRGTRKLMRVVFWNGKFAGFPVIPDPAWKIELVTNRGRLVSVSRTFHETVFTRMNLNYTGQFQHHMMNEKRDGWTLMLALPRDLCDSYGYCGDNGVCRIYKTPVCECLRGFQPKAENEWRIFRWESGCTRKPSADCQREDGFLKVDGLKFPDSLNFRLNLSMSIQECHDECLKNCDCTAYADPYFNNGSSCLMWFGNLIDIREQTEETGGGPSLYLRVPVSELRTDLNSGEEPTKTRIIISAAASCVGMFLLGSSFGGLFLRTRRRKQDLKMIGEELELPLIDYATIAAATNNFSRENLIGEGGFGPVYKANLSSEHVVAVKRMSRASRQGDQEFRNEVKLIAKLQHRNLIRLLGCCIEREENMLIYDYMDNKSLDYFIFDQERKALLTWPKRFDIIMGIARGLLYLHHDSRLKVIHRDLKTSNILLDENLIPKISDFGLARAFEGDQTTSRTKRIVGTYGYMSPEYAFDGNFSIKSDVFSMGVIILEIVSGKRNTGFNHPSYNSLLEQTWLLCDEGREIELMDTCCKNSFEESQVKRCIQVGLLCVQNKADERPLMSSVLLMLSTDDTALPRPQKPGFFFQCSSDSSWRNTSESKEYSSSVINTTDIEAGR